MHIFSLSSCWPSQYVASESLYDNNPSFSPDYSTSDTVFFLQWKKQLGGLVGTEISLRSSWASQICQGKKKYQEL